MEPRTSGTTMSNDNYTERQYEKSSISLQFVLRNFGEEQRKIGDRQSGPLGGGIVGVAGTRIRPSEILTILRIKGLLERRDRSRDRVLS